MIHFPDACCCSGLWAIKKKNGGKFPVHPKQAAAPAEGAAKAPKFYPAGPLMHPHLLIACPRRVLVLLPLH
jgi:hypothetical protein